MFRDAALCYVCESYARHEAKNLRDWQAMAHEIQLRKKRADVLLAEAIQSELEPEDAMRSADWPGPRPLGCRDDAKRAGRDVGTLEDEDA